MTNQNANIAVGVGTLTLILVASYADAIVAVLRRVIACLNAIQ